MAVNDRYEELGGSDPAVATLVTESELTGRRSIFLRGGRPVAILTSWDEYVALRETIEIAADPALTKELEQAGKAADAGDLLAPEDLFVE